MNFLTYQDLARDVLRLVPFCVEHGVSSIYGVPRSGLLPATMLAAALQVPVGVPLRIPEGMPGGVWRGAVEMSGRRVRKRPRPWHGPVLLLDDSVNSGTAISRAAKDLHGAGCGEFLTACVYTKHQSVGLVDIAARVLEGPRFYEWNVMNCDAGQRFMFDFDGVFCQDPKPFDDDGEKYQQAIRDAVPKYLTTWPVGWIATNRIERWREITEGWLQRHGIEVIGEIRMQPWRTAEDRRKHCTSASMKAFSYMAEPKCMLFIESHEVIASEIFERTRRPVLALDAMRLFQ